MPRRLDCSEYPREYRGLRQHDDYGCVYASIAGAVNHLTTPSADWTEASLRAACEGEEIPRSFDAIKVAVRAHNELKFVHTPLDRCTKCDSYVNAIAKAVRQGGVAIISFQVPAPSAEHGQCYHMVTLVEQLEHEVAWKAWDTAGYWLLLTESDLRTGFLHPCDNRRFSPHARADRLIVERLGGRGTPHLS